MRDIRWIDRAEQVEENYGTLVDYTERFYICPECGEPVYEDDWDMEDFEDRICPICGFYDLED